MGNDMYNDEQPAHAKAMSLKNNPRIGRSPGTVDEALSWLNRMAHGEPEMHLVSLRAAVDLVRRELFITCTNRDEWRRHAEEQLADVLRLRSLGIDVASVLDGIALSRARETETSRPMTAPARPVYPVPFAMAARGLPTLQKTDIQYLRDLNMRCLVRAYYGGHFRAALAFFRAGVAARWLDVHVATRLAWYRLRGLSKEEIDERFR